ncbi:predicted protein [Ostreococcus lucimarinus CCE9901]|uniref:Uncharacterized protein n=1 Tax=Ostreococcus lucimarinus (strain CCE9901) TaxID=436017 RepID=A4RZY2_OSTLU|nr:predicted protein [Ostreococcus lucimarinus CCE9901]ABO96941.1 predicted protein [Ostreococcus lucimarinus CCE9901]|eukprot:XP_001418648.1 predicted protein [Ostreococcus lucimarinus CCE9901]
MLAFFLVLFVSARFRPCAATRVSTRVYEKDDGATIDVTREHRLNGYFVSAVYTKP